jgi:NAD(P)-dependent dehydrogenase (short-subunit alcohol dehydrogenase family)
VKEAARTGAGRRLVALPGDVADPAHRTALADAVVHSLDLLVHNASTLGPVPLRPLRETTPEDLRAAWETNVVAPVALTGLLLPRLREAAGVLVGVTSDAAAEHYETWGAYAATKTALEHAVLTTGAEEGITAYAVDPGDLRTEMHQAAFPGEDLSDRPLPESVVPAFRRLLWHRPPSGRHRLADWGEPARSDHDTERSTA